MNSGGKKIAINLLLLFILAFAWNISVQPQEVHALYSPAQRAIIHEKLIDIVDKKMNGSYIVVVKQLERKAIDYGLDSDRGELLSNLAKNLQSHYEPPITESDAVAATQATLAEGCGKPTPTKPPTKISVDATLRSVITYVGSEYDPEMPTSLIIAFHGRTNSNSQVQSYYGLEKATKGQAIIVYPSALPENSSPRSWSPNRDFEFFDAIVEEMSDQYCIDQNKIYAVGHSLGAWFTNTLACARGDTLRAIGSVGGGITPNDCQSPTAAIIMHHPKDNLASFTSGLAARDVILEQNNCSKETRPVGPAWGNCVEYTCSQGDPVVWCPHSDSTANDGAYYPHTRPNNAGQEIWDFFQSLP